MPSGKKTDSTSAQKNFEENVDRWVQESASALRGRDDQPYDGVLGTPPEWFPENFQREFKGARNRLLDAIGYTPNQVRDLVATEFRRDRKAI
ncbi:MAG TPA: hypothetical protein VES92_02785, partial [Nitrospiraceae bacterium]|nr:hypothetical protein [Nitrospiraceae bacterium]